MARNPDQQPITKNPFDLAIGSVQIRLQEIDGLNLTNATADATASPLTASNSIGAVQQAALTGDSQYKTHSSGYPALEDAQILERTTVTASVSTEEILSAPVYSAIRDILGQVSGRAPRRYAMEARLEKGAGGGISYYANNAQVKSSFSVSTQNDWIGAELSIESIFRSAYTNSSLLYRTAYSAAARTRDNQAATLDPNALCIGLAQVRMGEVTPRGTTTASIGGQRMFSGINSSTLVGHCVPSGTYTGNISTGMVVQIVDTPTQRLGTGIATVAEPGATPTFDTVADGTLNFTVNAVDVYSVTFTPSTTLSIATVVSEINAAGPGSPASYYRDPRTGEYRILLTGSTSVEITTANTSLGFTVDGGVPTADKFTWYDIDGNPTANVNVTGAAQALAQGVSVTFGGATGASVLDTWVIPVVSSAAKGTSPAGTQVYSNYPFLKTTHSIGALQASSFQCESTIKEHFSGYPEKKDFEMPESSTVTLDVSVEEFDHAAGALTVGLATTLPDMIFDSSVNGARYQAPFEFMLMGLNGDVGSFWLPNADIIGQMDISASDDWAALPFQVKALIQSQSFFHANATVPDLVTFHLEDVSA